MHRRPLGRGRIVAALGAAIIVVGCLLPWWGFGGGDGLPARSGNAFDGSGIIVFYVALATIALLALPYAAGDVPVALDRPLTFVIILVVGWASLAIRVVDLWNLGALALPDRAPGLWLTALGLIVLSRAVYDIARERRV
ncbi:MAG TPA: hypothetical protein VHS36_08330 [Candidatus Limnocylindrales bacterium]|jgi:hypothetical protein|nr:hypothetical protein [Candidatus Limnocylindrales bacterium]